MLFPFQNLGCMHITIRTHRTKPHSDPGSYVLFMVKEFSNNGNHNNSNIEPGAGELVKKVYICYFIYPPQQNCYVVLIYNTKHKILIKAYKSKNDTRSAP